MAQAPHGQAHPASALVAFAEPLVRGRRVVVLGSVLTEVGPALLERGARLVHVYDPDAGRVAEHAASREEVRGLVVTVLADDLGVRDGAFDVVFVPDVTALGSIGEVLLRVRRLLSGSGVAILASPNSDAERFLLPPSTGVASAEGYYELFDAVSLQFPEVRMLGQAPFVGYSIVDFSEADPEVAVDTSSLEEPEAPEWYVALASERPIDLESSYSIIEVPLEEVARVTPMDHVTLMPPAGSVADVTMPFLAPPAASGLEPADATPEGLPEEAALSAGALADAYVAKIAERDRDLFALTEAQTRLAVVSTENEKLREQVADLVRLERAASQAALRMAELQHEVQAAQGRVTELEASAHHAASRAEAAEAEGLRLRAELEAIRDDEPVTPRTHATLQTEAARVARELEEARARIGELERQLSSLEPPTLRSKEEQAQRLLAAVTRAEAAEAAQRALEVRLAAAEAALARAVVARDEALAEAAAQPTADPAAVDALTAEVALLEQRLRERGREVSRLSLALREGERVGMELLFQLEDLHVLPSPFRGGPAPISGGSPPPGAGPGAPDGGAMLEAQVAELSERAARAQADLVAASWRISQLEREAREAAAPPHDPTRKETDLERALVLAQREIAELRAGARPAVAGVSEEAVLLEQIERARAEPAAPAGAPGGR